MITLALSLATYLVALCNYYFNDSMSKLSKFIINHSQILAFLGIVGSVILLVIAASLSIVLLAAGGSGGHLEHCNIATVCCAHSETSLKPY